LILQGADVEDGKTLLNKAASRGDAKMMYVLLVYGATKWEDRADGRKFFRHFFANCLLSSELSGMFEPFSKPD
jgi:hypothetical protein